MINFLAEANSIWIWLACAPTIILMLIQSTIFTKKAKEVSILVDLTGEEVKKAFRIGMISAIGPAFGVFLVMLGLSSQIGSPLAWLRLSIIGSASTELAVSQMAAQAMGTTLGAADNTIIVFANICWITALNGTSWLLISGLFTDKLDRATKKIAGGDIALLGTISVGAICGVMGYFLAREIKKGLEPGNTAFIISGVVAALSMIMLDFVSKKFPKIKEYSMGISMILGMASAVIFNSLVQA